MEGLNWLLCFVIKITLLNDEAYLKNGMYFKSSLPFVFIGRTVQWHLVSHKVAKNDCKGNEGKYFYFINTFIGITINTKNYCDTILGPFCSFLMSILQKLCSASSWFHNLQCFEECHYIELTVSC